MAEEFGHDDRIIGWQIDNEVYPQRRASLLLPGVRGQVPGLDARAVRHDRGAQRGLVHRLYGARPISRSSSFPSRRPDIWHHPSLLAAWDQFNSRSYVDFVEPRRIFSTGSRIIRSAPI